MYDDIDEHTDDDAVAAIRKAVRNDDANKLIGILESTQITPNTPIAITLQSSVDRKKKLSLLWPPIILAAYAQKLRVMNVLLEMDSVDVNAYDSSSVGRCRNALHIAARYHCPEALELLVRSPRVDINAKDVDGNTALHLSAISNDSSAVTTLLTNESIDVNVVNNEGDTPAHIAAEGGFVTVMKELMQHDTFNGAVLDAEGRDVMQRAQSLCATLPAQQNHSLADDNDDLPSVGDCTQIIHLLSKHTPPSVTVDENLTITTSARYENVSIQHRLAATLALRLLSTGANGDILRAPRAHELPLAFLGVGAPLGDVSEEDVVFLCDYLMSVNDHEEESGSGNDIGEVSGQQDDISAKALRVAIFIADPNVVNHVINTLSSPTTIFSRPEIAEAIAWLHRVCAAPSKSLYLKTWSWGQWLCYFCTHSDVFVAHFDRSAGAHSQRHPLCDVRQLANDSYALEIATQLQFYIMDVLKYEKTSCVVSLKYTTSPPMEEQLQPLKCAQPHELVAAGEHHELPNNNARERLLEIATDNGLFQCSLERTYELLRSREGGALPA